MRAASRTSSEMVAMPPTYMAITKPDNCQVAAIATGIMATGIPSFTCQVAADGQMAASSSVDLQDQRWDR